MPSRRPAMKGSWTRALSLRDPPAATVIFRTASLRWAAGLVGLAVMTWMTWQTMKIPNTQSATGILYVALVFVFLGELASALLSFGNPLPL